MPSQRQRKLDAVVARLQLQYGPRAVRKMPLPAQPVAAPHISTTFPDLDATLGIGGLPRGRITEIIGPATSGKVTLAAKALSAAHRDRDALVAWLDLSRTCDPDYLYRCGLDLERLLIVRPRTTRTRCAGLAPGRERHAGRAGVRRPGGGRRAGRGAPGRQAGTAGGRGDVHRDRCHLPGRAHAQSRTLAHLAALRLAIRRERWNPTGRMSAATRARSRS